MKFSLLSALLMGLTGVAHAGIYPSTPVGDTVWKVGSKVTISWSDNEQQPPLSKIEPFEVALYTGSDMKQTKLAVIASNVAGTTTSLEYVVPDVTPYGKIYFLRFTAPNATNPEEPTLFWSTRFTITNSDSTQPSPSTVGTGQLASPTASVPISFANITTTTSAQHSASSVSTSVQASSSSLKTSQATLASPSQAIITPSAVGASVSKPASEPLSTISSTKNDGNGLAASNALWTLLPIVGFLTFY
ncbi:hypothetical protein K493DRAFT_314247 [Basidiobolus meristosporus CBS 931.73]|uniref:Yeast cell wall synthesis Kre9/Knh1-like N-terminal domain-containing protein n=1 Tax=Basidiobolus meristosporus CBS 931.73 TaxID=1314790 RepID=A0A1Y1YGP9_9FUNG|nr:hypothetical protein K493DRAFT_314247 [Basidiobolus meristosporus CBS 931.73]|eukprot:ORX97033.1 hypothetical protein K493DRAFT_314247 [Basidiobolus meristosporus CBS 931.73]